MAKDRDMPFVWFFVGFALFIFTRSVTFIPLAMVIAPLFNSSLLANAKGR